MGLPCVTIDLDKIEHNARIIVGLCHEHGIEVTGVTKGVCGHPDVAKAMLRGGVSSIGESRMENVSRLRVAGIEAPIMLLRLPQISQVDEVVGAVEVSLNSELAVLEGLSEAAQRQRRTHDVIVMVDLGDLREGVWSDDLIPFMRRALRLPGIRIVGLGANLTCFGGVVPSERNMGQLAEQCREIEETFGLKLKWISGVNSSGLELIASGRTPSRINHARIGEAILLGRETVHRRPWPGAYQDAFLLHAEVLEVKRKPSIPIGERSEDAFGNLPAFPDKGLMNRALVNVGREDVDVAGLRPLDGRLAIFGGSSGYLAIDATGAKGSIRVGDELAFSLNYGALLAAMTSEYVKKRPLRGGAPAERKG